MAFPLTGQQFQASPGAGQWRVLGEGVAAWYASPTDGQARGAALVSRVLARVSRAGAPIPDLDLRPTGVRVTLPWREPGFTVEQVATASFVTEAASNLGLTPDPTRLQDLQVTIDVTDQERVQHYWHALLGQGEAGHRLDPEDLRHRLRLLSPIWFQPQDSPRPLRNRLHLDVVATHPQVTAALAAIADDTATLIDPGPFGVRLADPEGNEADLLWRDQGDDRWKVDGLDLDDWRLVFDAQSWWLVTDPTLASRLVTRAAERADASGLPLRVSVRAHADDPHSCWVVVSTGKDLWETPGYAQLCADVQAAARELGLVAHSEAARFVQVGIDAADIGALRRFWAAALDHQPDPRDGVTDLVDPRGIGMPVFFQNLDITDQARLAQRNRIHLDLYLPADEAERRLAACVAAGGRVVRDRAPFWWTVADPEGNEIDLSVSAGREEGQG